MSQDAYRLKSPSAVGGRSLAANCAGQAVFERPAGRISAHLDKIFVPGAATLYAQRVGLACKFSARRVCVHSERCVLFVSYCF